MMKALLELLKNLTAQLEHLTELAKRKTQAVQRDDLNGLDQVMKEEQAATLALRGYDNKRDKLLAELGIPGTGLQDLPGHCPPDLQMEAKRITEELRHAYATYTAAAEVSRNTLECNLHEIEKVLASAGSGPLPNGPGYTERNAGNLPPVGMRTDFHA